MEKFKEDDITNEIKGKRSRLESELNALRKNNGEEIGKNKDIQDKIDTYRNKKRNEEKSRQELIRQLNEIQEEITDIKGKSNEIDRERIKLKEEEEALREELRVKKDSYNEYRDQIQTKKAEFQKYKSAALVMARNKEEQTKLYNKQQEAFGEKIKKLIGDAQVLMYADTADVEEMKNKLISQHQNLEDQLTEELRSYQELIESIERNMN